MGSRSANAAIQTPIMSMAVVDFIWACVSPKRRLPTLHVYINKKGIFCVCISCTSISVIFLRLHFVRWPTVIKHGHLLNVVEFLTTGTS